MGLLVTTMVHVPGVVFRHGLDHGQQVAQSMHNCLSLCVSGLLLINQIAAVVFWETSARRPRAARNADWIVLVGPMIGR